MKYPSESVFLQRHERLTTAKERSAFHVLLLPPSEPTNPFQNHAVFLFLYKSLYVYFGVGFICESVRFFFHR